MSKSTNTVLWDEVPTMVEIVIHCLYFDSRSIALMDEIPCTGNDATGNEYRVTGGI
jgi:hypothetical protein